jgi:16S rRNA (guanine966-N2)-methyltransferase
MDPPYALGLAQAALDRIGRGGWLAPGGWLSDETAAESLALPPGLRAEAERRFGKATIHLFRAAP